MIILGPQTPKTKSGLEFYTNRVRVMVSYNMRYCAAHRSNKNSKINDDNPETVEILQNPTTKYDAHKAEENV